MIQTIIILVLSKKIAKHVVSVSGGEGGNGLEVEDLGLYGVVREWEEEEEEGERKAKKVKGREEGIKKEDEIKSVFFLDHFFGFQTMEKVFFEHFFSSVCIFIFSINDFKCYSF